VPLFGPFAAPARAQAPETLPKQPAPPPPQPRPADEVFDPYHAQKAVDVGEFYMKKGDIDAAIDRFKDAIRLKPNFAKPRLLLGDLYAKKGDKKQAIRYYKEFLEIMPPGSPDTKRVQKQIEKLSQK
jgi:tetratricopeptide (TPR) repeat protein